MHMVHHQSVKRGAIINNRLHCGEMNRTNITIDTMDADTGFETQLCIL